MDKFKQAFTQNVAVADESISDISSNSELRYSSRNVKDLYSEDLHGNRILINLVNVLLVLLNL